MERYAKYKDSGVDWIGEIPEGWVITKVEQVFTSRRETVSDRDYAPLSVTKSGIVPQLENVAKTDNRDNRLLVRKGDFVINSRSDRRGSCGFSRMDGSVTQISLVLNPQNIEEIDVRYYSWLFSCERFSDEFYRNGHGIVADLWSTKWSDMKGIYLPKPPVNERAQIVAYLDQMTSEIDAAVADIERSIELLNEYRQSVISEVVTKGLDTDVHMKDSGIEWIGSIPTTWSSIRLKSILVCIEQGWSPASAISIDEIDGWHVLTLSAVKHGTFIPSAVKPIDSNLNIPSQLELSDGDLLMTRSNTKELVGDVCIVEDCLPKTIPSDLIYRITVNKSLAIPRFIMYMMLSNPVRQQISAAAKGSSGTMPKISHNIIKQIQLCLPTYAEQRQIIRYLDQSLSAIDSLITQKQSLLVRLREYRNSLISECVTGKVRVPGVEED